MRNPLRSIRGRTIPLAAAALALLLAACGDEASPTQPGPAARRLTLCETDLSVEQLAAMLHGNMHVAAGFRRDGLEASGIVAGFVVGLLLNTVDFTALDDWKASFSKGVYRVRNGVNTLDFILQAEEPFAAYQPGDTIFLNLLDPASYVRDVKATVSGGVSFERGPAYDLVSGDVSWKNLTPRVRLDATRLSLTIVSTGNWYFEIPAPEGLQRDTVRSRMVTTRLNLAELRRDFQAGRIGFSYDSTLYRNTALKLRQDIRSSLFEMKPLDAEGKAWSWEGSYASRIEKEVEGREFRLFMTGSVSTVGHNRTTYYCDEAQSDSLGSTVDDTSGVWGYFKSVRGDSIPYGLIPAGK